MSQEWFWFSQARSGQDMDIDLTVLCDEKRRSIYVHESYLNLGSTLTYYGSLVP